MAAPSAPAGADRSAEIAERVERAAADGTALAIRGGGSKAFYGREPRGEALDVTGHAGIVTYEPSELMLTARAGTPLAEIEATLAEAGQMLAFEPPHFGGGATLGGAIAAGLSGPCRAFAGAARDFVLGTRVVNGRGESMRFGGEVMKNVAGYDVSRLMTGALGTLGVVTEVSLKILPAPQAEATRSLALEPAAAMDRVGEWTMQGLPVSATAHDGERLHVRLSGPERAVAAAAETVGGETPLEPDSFWAALRDQQLAFFTEGEAPLWRLALPPLTPALELDASAYHEWNGQQRWLRTDASADTVRAAAATPGGHAALFRGGDREGEVFHPPEAGVLRLHRRLKEAFDPAGVLNPGRLHAGL